MKKLLLTIVLLLMLTACTSPSASSPPSASPVPSGSPALAGYSFSVRDVTVYMGQPADPYIEALGEPQNLFEAESCAFDGIDRIYTYAGFQLYTFPKDGVDYVLSVSLTDDSLSTDKGIYLGRTLEDVLAAYGEGYAQNQGEYAYTLDGSVLSFLVENREVTSITWRYAAA